MHSHLDLDAPSQPIRLLTAPWSTHGASSATVTAPPVPHAARPHAIAALAQRITRVLFSAPGEYEAASSLAQALAALPASERERAALAWHARRSTVL